MTVQARSKCVIEMYHIRVSTGYQSRMPENFVGFSLSVKQMFGLCFEMADHV
jgi:hypothetical protein